MQPGMGSQAPGTACKAGPQRRASPGPPCGSRRRSVDRHLQSRGPSGLTMHRVGAPVTPQSEHSRTSQITALQGSPWLPASVHCVAIATRYASAACNRRTVPSATLTLAGLPETRLVRALLGPSRSTRPPKMALGSPATRSARAAAGAARPGLAPPLRPLMQQRAALRRTAPTLRAQAQSKEEALAALEAFASQNKSAIADAAERLSRPPAPAAGAPSTQVRRRGRRSLQRPARCAPAARPLEAHCVFNPQGTCPRELSNRQAYQPPTANRRAASRS